jgi:hypothetical protein
MPLWLEHFFLDHPVLVWAPLAVCVGGAVLLWWWQSGRKGGKRKVVRVGWFGAVAAVVVVVGGIALAGHLIGLWGDVWTFVNMRPGLVAWWMAAVGGAVMVWGVAVHAWRGEALLARQCRGCGYDMTGVQGLMTCPECGRVVKNEKQLRPRNVRRSALWAGGALMLLAVAMPTMLAVSARGVAAALPNRALLWWVAATGSPPDSVMVEVLRRSAAPEEGLFELRSRNADVFARRLLAADGPSVEFYAVLVESLPISEAVRAEALAQMASGDATKRSAALRVLTGAANPVEIDQPLIAKWEADADPKVASLAVALRYAQMNMAAARLIPTDGAAALSVEDLRRYLRLCTSTQHPASIYGQQGVAQLVRHGDPEVAALAACLVGAHEFDQIEQDPEKLVGMMRAKETLDRLPSGSGPSWASAGYWVHYPRLRGGEVLRRLIDDKDPAVRDMVYRQCSPSATIGVGESWGSTIGLWSAILPALETRLETESDAGARKQLANLIEEIKGPPPAGRLP